MKFKVGDRVKNIGRESYCGICLGDIGTVIEESSIPFVKWDKNKNLVAFDEEDLELVYTYEDLKKSPIGTKVTFENGTVLVKDEEDFFENASRCRDIANLYNLQDGCNIFGKIIKIEEPTYQTVYESKVEILDEVEKRYLRGVIRPFRNNVEVIRKLFSPTKGKYYIQIRYKDEPPTNLPYFESKEMYKNMKTDKIYTLKELRL